MKSLYVSLLLLGGSIGLLFGQRSLQDIQLTSAFHKDRRAALRALMPPKSVAIFFAAPVRNRSHDVEYVYHQNPDFFYLTGYTEPHTLLLIFKDTQQDEQGNRFHELLFIRPRHARQELYDGARLSIAEAKQRLGFEVVYLSSDFASLALGLSSFDKILFLTLPEDVRNTKEDTTELYDLVLQFKHKVEYPLDFHSDAYRLYQYVSSADFATRADAQAQVQELLRAYPAWNNKAFISRLLKAKNPETRKRLLSSLEIDQRLEPLQLSTYMTTLREIKSPQEIAILRSAIDISCVGQVEVMKAIRVGMSEREIQGIHEYVYKKYGAAAVGYPSIVGAGHNGCVLHYIDNAKENLGTELILMDLGAEVHGYTADVTRTIPVNGTFSREQRAIYELVLEAQEAAFKNCKPGNTIADNTRICRQVINKGLARLGIIEHKNNPHNYLPHGVTHHIGLDVHDRGHYTTFAENMVLTVEPGIYIPKNSPCEPKWWGIAVRIEDDILITQEGYEVLSTYAPRAVAEIEALMQEDHPLKRYTVPALEELR